MRRLFQAGEIAAARVAAVPPPFFRNPWNSKCSMHPVSGAAGAALFFVPLTCRAR